MVMQRRADIVQNVDEDFSAQGYRAREVHVVRRNARPNRRHKQDFGDLLFKIFREARRDENVDLEGQVWTMLLHGADRHQGNHIFSVELFDLRPVQFSEFHGCHSLNKYRCSGFTRETIRAEPWSTSSPYTGLRSRLVHAPFLYLLADNPPPSQAG